MGRPELYPSVALLFITISSGLSAELHRIQLNTLQSAVQPTTIALGITMGGSHISLNTNSTAAQVSRRSARRSLQLQRRHKLWRHIRPSMISTFANKSHDVQYSLRPDVFEHGRRAALPPAQLLTVQIPARQHAVAPGSAALQQHMTCRPLSVDKLASAAVNLTVMLMATDYSTAEDLLHHWLGNVRAANIRNYLIAATDDATSTLLAQRGLAERCYRLSGTAGRFAQQGYRWAPDSWKDATWLKVTAAHEILQLGYNVIMSDIDVMWLTDPLPFLLNDTKADFLISLDAHYSDKAAGDPGLEKFHLGRLMNTGVYFARARIQVLKLFQQWLSLRRANHDQEAFKLLMNTAAAPIEAVPGNERLGKILAGSVVMGHLPLSSYMHSYSYSIMQLHKLSRTPPFEVHMVFGYGHKESKIYKLRDAGLGHDPLDSDYYHPPGGVLSFELVRPQIPAAYDGWSVEDLSHTEEDMEVLHNRAIDFQLQQLYHAMGLALALNRTLIMPPMLCFCARGWYANEACRLVGDTVSQLPFVCTGDQVFNIEALTKPNTSVAGVYLRVRPPGFASDKRLPLHLTQHGNKVLITLGSPKCNSEVNDNSTWQHHKRAAAASNLNADFARAHIRGEQFADVSAGCVTEATNADGQRQVTLPMGRHGEALANLLQEYAAIPWLHFSNVTAAFAGFEVNASQTAFEELLSTVVAEWCCRDNKRVVNAGVPDGHLHQIRPWGSPQRFCAKRLEWQKFGDRVHSYFC